MKILPIPSPCEEAFLGNINHPELFLWDAWSLDLGDEIRLFSLAVNRNLADGSPLYPHLRNQVPFHVRQFKTLDGGISWTDEGAFQTSGHASDGHDSRNIWSGSILQVEGQILVSYTGVRELDEQRPFFQSLAVAPADLERGLLTGESRVLLCPFRDESLIRDAGYFLDQRPRMGHRDGEQGGPIMAWRDPYLFEGAQPGELFMAWAAKGSPTEPVMGLARMGWHGTGCSIKEVYPPVVLPDSDHFSQFEVPKIYADPVAGGYILVAATTTRVNEVQSDAEVTKLIRIYRARNLAGPWQPISSLGSHVAGLDHLFGMTVLRFDAEQQKMLCISPVSETAGSQLGLSFSSCFELFLPDATGDGQVRVNWIA